MAAMVVDVTMKLSFFLIDFKRSYENMLDTKNRISNGSNGLKEAVLLLSIVSTGTSWWSVRCPIQYRYDSILLRQKLPLKLEIDLSKRKYFFNLACDHWNTTFVLFLFSMHQVVFVHYVRCTSLFLTQFFRRWSSRRGTTIGGFDQSSFIVNLYINI